MTKTEYRFEGYRLDTGSGKLLSPEGSPLALSSRAFSVLHVLLANAGQILAKNTLMDAAWPDVIVEENNLNQAISQIRRTLGDSKSESRFIQTVPGRGYRFNAQVCVLHALPDDEPPTAQAEPWRDEPRYGLLLAARRPWTATRALLLAVTLLAAFLLPFFFKQNGAGTLPSVSADGFSDVDVFAPDASGVIEDSLAVLPFDVLNTSPDGDLFAFGLHDEIINQLSRIRGLNVIARNSVTTLTRDQPSVPQIGQRLGVEAVISGSILFQGDQGERARVSLRMLEPASGVILWASTYEAQTRDLAALVGLYRDVVLNAAMALAVPVNPEERQALEALPTASFDAYRYYLAANAAYYALDYQSAWKLSKQAISLDPHYYDALYTYASVNTVLIGAPLPGMDSRQHHAMALEAAQRMIAVAPGRTEGHALKASVHGTSREWSEVAASMAKLRALNASLSDMRFLAPVLLCLGDFAGAIDILEANLRVEPVNLYARGFLMMALELAGNRLQARQEYELGETLTPLWWGDTVEVFLALGRREPLRDIGEQYGLSEELITLLRAVDAGDHDRIHPQLLHYSRQSGGNSAEALFYAAIAAHEGHADLALQLARQALTETWLTLHWFWLPVFDELRPLPGFQALLRESGLPAYWEKHGWPAMCQPRGEGFHCDWKAYP